MALTKELEQFIALPYTDECLDVDYSVTALDHNNPAPSFHTPPVTDDDEGLLPVGPAYDGDVQYEEVETDLQYDRLTSVGQVQQTQDRFRGHITRGNALSAASVLVTQAAYQNPLSSSSMLPRNNIMLFLHLAKLVMSSGGSQQHHLAKVLAILYPYADCKEKGWAPIPCTVSGFRSKITNVSNSNSLVSILPIPAPETLPDGHGYTPFRKILSHALMLKNFSVSETKDPKWQSLASCEKFVAFLNSIPVTMSNTSPIQMAVGTIVWTDGWDTSTGCKSNRSPMHTGTVTLVFVTVSTGMVLGIATYPNMGGPGKIDHGPVFYRFQQDMAAFESSDLKDRVFACRHLSRDVVIHTQILFVVQDQPERRQASGLLGGGSNLHALFGMSCDFNKLESPFNACTQCQFKVHQYIERKNWLQNPMADRCSRCLSWNTNHLSGVAYTQTFPRPNNLTEVDPGYMLFDGPRPLTSTLLLKGWNHCIRMFAITHQWVESDVKKYLGQLCLNEATISTFVNSCRRHVYLRDVNENAEDYTHDEIASVIRDSVEHPSRYELPLPPAMWQLGEVQDKTEGVMHLSMGVQKAVFKFVIRWANGNRKGAALQRRLAASLGAVQDLKLSYCPCRAYKDEKFGGFTAEVYRAMTMISCFLYLCLLEEDLEPLPPRGPNPAPQKEWTRQDNINWMYTREIEYSETITLPEAKEQVRRELGKSRTPTLKRPLPTPVTRDEIRDLVFRMNNMFRAIFCADISGVPAMNRATASVMRFLSLMESLDVKLNPKRKNPIWIAKFNFLGLLRVCGSFARFQHVRNLYEGGVVGEGVVKLLRPLVAKGVHQRWATNLLLAHYRQSTLEILIQTAEDSDTSPRSCPLGDDVESSKFKRYSTAAKIIHQMSIGFPLPVLLYGGIGGWKAGAIIVTQNRWLFREIQFSLDIRDAFVDRHGMTYHRVSLAPEEILLGVVDIGFSNSLGDTGLVFWDYATLLPDTIHDTINYRYSILRSGWQYLDAKHEWSEHD
jgi:hypothetical protein